MLNDECLIYDRLTTPQHSTFIIEHSALDTAPYVSRWLWVFFHPDFAFRRVFEFPDRRDLFQFIDRPHAGTERLSSMLSPHDNQYDLFADAYFTIPVEDRNLDNVKILQRPFANFAQLLLRHTLIMF